jgi:hypothetical protein
MSRINTRSFVTIATLCSLRASTATILNILAGKDPNIFNYFAGQGLIPYNYQ